MKPQPGSLAAFSACFLALLALACCARSTPRAGASAGLDARAPQTLAVMTFNVRYGTADDGPDAWPLRRELVLDAIRELAPAILGVQEALDFQLAWLEQRLPNFRRLGQGREGGTRDEHAALFVERERFEVLESGDFWLSERPDEVASVGWDAALTRICTWARLRERATGRELTVWNAHFDHRGEQARVHSAQLLAERVQALHGARLVLGDFNAGERSQPLATLLACGLRDSFRALHPDTREVGTFHAFRGGLAGEKIDHVLATHELEPVEAAIHSAPGANGRWPSDHHPVSASFAWKPRAP